MLMLAYCWWSGRIEFGRVLPFGARLIVRGPGKIIRRAVKDCALPWDNGRTLVVPGMLLAKNGKEVVEAYREFRTAVRQVADARLEEERRKNPSKNFLGIS